MSFPLMVQIRENKEFDSLKLNYHKVRSYIGAYSMSNEIKLQLQKTTNITVHTYLSCPSFLGFAKDFYTLTMNETLMFFSVLGNNFNWNFLVFWSQLWWFMMINNHLCIVCHLMSDCGMFWYRQPPCPNDQCPAKMKVKSYSIIVKMFFK